MAILALVDFAAIFVKRLRIHGKYPVAMSIIQGISFAGTSWVFFVGTHATAIALAVLPLLATWAILRLIGWRKEKVAEESRNPA